MDLNDYYYRQLFSQLQADRAGTEDARLAYQERADTYARLIWEEQRRRGATIATLANRPGRTTDKGRQQPWFVRPLALEDFQPFACA